MAMCACGSAAVGLLGLVQHACQATRHVILHVVQDCALCGCQSWVAVALRKVVAVLLVLRCASLPQPCLESHSQTQRTTLCYCSIRLSPAAEQRMCCV